MSSFLFHLKKKIKKCLKFYKIYTRKILISAFQFNYIWVRLKLEFDNSKTALNYESRFKIKFEFVKCL